jgi:predicted transcriptional regulator
VCRIVDSNRMLHFSNKLTSSLENLNGAVDRLRQETNLWLSSQGIKQNTVASLLGVSEAFFSKFLSGEKDISAKTYAKLSFLVGKKLELNAGTRIVQHTSNGKPVADMPINIGVKREQFNDEHANQIRLSGKNKNANSMFAGPEDTRKNLSI